MLGLPPYCRCDDNELTSYVEGVKELLPPTMPVLLYNNTVRNGYGPSLPTLISWFQRGLIIGVKYAVAVHSLALTNSKWLLDQEPNLKLYTGSDALFRELAGRDGFHPAEDINSSVVASSASAAAAASGKVYQYYGLTSIVGNICPYFMGQTVLHLTGESKMQTITPTSTTPTDDTRAYQDDTIDTFALGCNMHDQILPLVQSVIVNVTIPVGIKYALHLRGIDAGVGRRPVGILSTTKEDEIKTAVEVTKALM